MNKKTERTIQKIYEEIYKKLFNRKNISTLLKKNDNDLKSSAMNMSESKQFNEFAEKYAKQLAAQNVNKRKGAWRKFYAKAKAKHLVGLPDTYKKFELQIFQKAVLHNFKMIKTIPQYVLEIEGHKYASDLIEQVAQGKLSRKSFERQLKQHGWKNAKVIARTETAKLQTAVTEYESKELGSVAYIWRSSKDKRTRPSHRAMNDVVVFWRNDNEKPLLDGMRGNAGEFPNCRCDCHAIYDELDLTSSTYKVYDYRNDKVISMTKSELLKSIKQGELVN